VPIKKVCSTKLRCFIAMICLLLLPSTSNRCVAQSSILEKGTSGGSLGATYQFSHRSNSFLMGLSYSAKGQADISAAVGRAYGDTRAFSIGMGIYPIKEHKSFWPFSLGIEGGAALVDDQAAAALSISLYRSQPIASRSFVQLGAGFGYVNVLSSRARDYGAGLFSLGLFIRASDRVILGITPSVMTGHITSGSIGFGLVLAKHKKRSMRNLDNWNSY